MSLCGLSTWLTLGSRGSKRGWKEQQPPNGNTQTSAHIPVATVPLVRASPRGGGCTVCECRVWLIGGGQGNRPPPLHSLGKSPGAQIKCLHVARILSRTCHQQTLKNSFFYRENNNFYDLNRNFPDAFEFNNESRQPETVAIMEWLKTETFVLSANLHGGALVASYPFDNGVSGKQTRLALAA